MIKNKQSIMDSFADQLSCNYVHVKQKLNSKIERTRVHHSRTSVENEYLPQVAAAGEVARVEEVQRTRRRRRRSSLQT
jgi:hypothetical protein